MTLPIIPVAAAVLPNGNMIAWSSDSDTSFEGDIGTAPSHTLAAFFNPLTGFVSKELDTGVKADMFCPGIAYLADGRILVNGGSSSYHTALYDPFHGDFGTWSDSKNMNIPRGYNSSVTLSNGKVFTIGGSWSGGAAPKDGELWDPATGTWSLEHFASELGRLYPYLGAEAFMAGSYSRDLRGRVLAAVEAGESVEAAAERFVVGRSTAYRWVTAARAEGRREAKPMHGGPAPRIRGEAEAAMLELAGDPNHLTLAEIAARLAETHGVRVHLTTVHRALRRAGWT